MSTSMSTGVKRALSILDVPLVVAEGLRVTYGGSVWGYLVRNPMATQCGAVAARRMLDSPFALEANALSMLMDGVELEVPGVVEVVAGHPVTPRWLIVWLLRRSTTSSSVLHSILTEGRFGGIEWYHQHTRDMVRAVWSLAPSVREREHPGAVDIEKWGEADALCERREEELRGFQAMRNSEEWRGSARGRTRQPTPSVERCVTRAREVLGDGQSGDSLSAWERFFELAGLGASVDLNALIDAAHLVMGEAHHVS